MLFTSGAFFLLTALTFFVYYLRPLRRLQIPVLILASFLFYGYDQPWLLLLLVASIALNVAASRAALSPDRHRARIAVTIGVSLNLAILCLFKYSPLFARTFLANVDDEHSLGHFLVRMPLPIGISFFTFQGISLVVDLYRSHDVPQFRELARRTGVRYWLDVTLFKAFFPQLISGPIVKAHEFLPQITEKKFSDVPWEWVFRKLVLGYFLKVVVADNLKDHTFWIAYPYFLNLPGWKLAVMLLGYSMQIFADFAGYSLIAMGIGGLFGYRLPTNFDMPYISRSFAEFWRRWHISLSTFLRDYLYFPLGGNRHGTARTYFNLFVVMFLGGLWHGAAWSYAVWGTAHGVALIVERFAKGKVTLPDTLAVRSLQRLGVFVFVSAAWLLFKLNHFEHAVLYVRCLTRGWSGVSLNSFLDWAAPLLLFSVPVALYHAWALAPRPVADWTRRRSLEFVYGAMAASLLLSPGSPGAFIYFQF